MNTMYAGDKVKYKTQEGNIVEAELLEYFSTDAHDELIWWVKYPRGEELELTVCEESRLKAWNAEKICSCGSKSVGSPKHSYYCDYNEEAL